MNNYILYIGLNDKDKLIQLIPTAKAKDIINEVLKKNNINAYSIFDMMGVFTNEAGVTTTERSIKVEILREASDSDFIFDLVEVVNKLKVKLNQEAIGIDIIKSSIKWY